MTTTPQPVFEVQGGPPTDAAVAALARLLLAVVDAEETHNTHGAGGGTATGDNETLPQKKGGLT